MEYVYSALLLHAVGKEINEANVTEVLKAAGVGVDAARVKALTAALEGVNIEEAISTAVAMPGPAAAAPAAPADEKKEDKKEEKKEEKKVSDEEAAAGLSALFG